METHAITHKNFKPENITFSNVKRVTSGGTSFKRIYVTYEYPNGETDKIHIQTPKLLSWGVQPNHDDAGAESHTLPIVMYDSMGPTEKESKTIELFDGILSLIEAHLKDPVVKKDTERYDMDPDVDRMKVF